MEVGYTTKSLNEMLLAKLGMIGDKNEEEEGSKLKLQTIVGIEQQMEQILCDSEFSVEISTPQNPQTSITENGLI